MMQPPEMNSIVYGYSKKLLKTKEDMILTIFIMYLFQDSRHLIIKKARFSLFNQPKYIIGETRWKFKIANFTHENPPKVLEGFTAYGFTP